MIKYVNIQAVLREKGRKYPELGIFYDTGNVIKVLCWQPKGEIVFSEEEGFRCNSNDHIEKATSFLLRGNETKADIILSPEYSVPWSILQRILEEQEPCPLNGKLWCLGLEGISCQELKKFLVANVEKNIICEDVDKLIQNQFYSCIAYIFRDGDQEITCIIQLKTTAAADRWAELEAGGLAAGSTIYYFKAINAAHCLFTYICADALNQQISEVKREVGYQKCIILHPQLNPRPLHDSFSQMRKSFLDYSQRNIRIIAVNWAKDSYLIREDGEAPLVIEDSYSAYYCNQDSQNKYLEKLINKNKYKGINLARSGHIFVWHMPSNEHVMLFSIDCFDSRSLNLATAKHQEPIGMLYCVYNEKSRMWEEDSGCRLCTIDWDWLKKQFSLEKCSAGKCDILKLEKFFSILFVDQQNEEYSMTDGISRVIYEKGSQSHNIIKMRERAGYVNQELERGNIPEKFSEFRNMNYRWTLQKEGNLQTKDESNLINVTYVDSSNESLISYAISEFQILMGEAAKDRLLLYYFTNEGIKYYDKLFNVEINNPNLTLEVDKIN